MMDLNTIVKELKAVPCTDLHRVSLLNDASIAYLVTGGEVAVYVARMRDDIPVLSRRMIHTFGEGELIFCGPDLLPGNEVIPGSEGDIGDKLSLGLFMIISREDKCEVKQVSIDNLLGEHSLKEYVTEQVDNWANKILGEVILYFGFSNRLMVTIDHNQPDIEIKQNSSAQSKQMIWLQAQELAEDKAEEPDQLALTYDDKQGDLTSSPEFPFKPLPVRSKIDVNADLTLKIFSTPELFKQGMAEKTIAEIDRHIKVLLYQQLLVEEYNEWGRMERAEEIQAQNLTTSLENFHNAFVGKEDITPLNMVVDKSLLSNRLMLTLCQITNSDIQSLDNDLVAALDLKDIKDMEKLLNMNGFFSRNIELTEDWYKKNNWMLLAYFEGQDYPILMRYDSNKYRYYDPVVQQWNILTSKLAPKVAREAIMIYRPLREGMRTVKDMFIQGLYFSRIDVRRVFVTAIFIALINLLNPILMGWLMAEALPQFDFSKIDSILIGLFAATVGVVTLSFFNSIALLRIESYFSLDIHASVWGRLLQLPMTFFEQHTVGDLASRANIFDDIQAVWTASTARIMTSSVSMVFSLGLLFYYSWSLSLLALLFFSLFLILVYIITRKVVRLIVQIFDLKGKLDGLVFQLLMGIAKLRVASKENAALSLWSNIYNKLTITNRQYMMINNLLQITASALPILGSVMLFSFIYYGLLGDGGYQQDFDLGDFISFNAAFGQVAATILSLSMVFLSVVTTFPMIDRMRPILEAKPEVTREKAMIRVVRGNIVFDKVTFHYQPDIPVLNDICMSINEGEYVAIVGRSGSGKSTLLSLLLGFQNVKSGAIFVDGTNVEDVNLSNLRQKIGVVLQHSSILPGSIYENISCGNTEITMDDAWEAAEKAGLKQDLEDLPMKMHTLISEFGGGLSGGQLQRLMIARSLSGSPSILLFDEATSALDNTTQKIVQDSLKDMSITRVVIAHRLSTIRDVDCIYVLDKGVIIEQGNFETLMQGKGLFYDLAVRQLATES